MYDYSKLRGRIVEVCGTRAVFAKRMGLSERSISCKLNNKIQFNQHEIERAIDVLGLDDDDIQTYFFAKQVQGVEPATAYGRQEGGTT